MIFPQLPLNEKLRQRQVEKYQLLDTLSEETYDAITRLISYICETPISLITLLDKQRNFLKSHHGISFNESPRELSFCGHAINSDQAIMTVEDARVDERFHDNPIVSEHGVVFYAGVPLVNPEGYKLGTLCVYDVKPRKLTTQQEDALQSMANQVMHLFEARIKNKALEQLKNELEEQNKNLEKFAQVVSHDLKSPLAQITTLTGLIEEDAKKTLSDETLEYFDYIKDASDSLRGYIDGILKFYRTSTLWEKQREIVSVIPFVEGIEGMFKGDQKAIINLRATISEMDINKAALTQIFMNLIANAIKYNDKARPIVNLTIFEKGSHYSFSVADNGPGIPKQHLDSIFDLFTTFHKADKNGVAGTGIGLAAVKKVIYQLGGDISVTSSIGEGSTFSFSIPK